jgi:phosphoribosylformimino-5-aminoimidazole carboxamide ribotide isomerase
MGFYCTQHERKIIEAMKFRPCIDLHSGQVKQIVGSTLSDKKEEDGEDLATNFETDRPAESYAEMYKNDNLTGGHVIMLGPGNNKAVS